MDEFFKAHNKVALLFSGGKDSVAMMELARPYWDKVVFVWVNTGANFPEVVEFMESVRQQVPHFVEIKSNQPMSISEHGYPTDVVPVTLTTDGYIFEKECKPIKVCSKYDCCRRNIWKPLEEFFMNSDIDGVLKGQKESDEHQAMFESSFTIMCTRGHTVDVCYPLRYWTDAQVREYIRERGYYDERFDLSHSSLDCWSCTGYWSQLKERKSYMAKHHPKHLEMVEHVIKEIKNVALKEMEKLNG